MNRFHIEQIRNGSLTASCIILGAILGAAVDGAFFHPGKLADYIQKWQTLIAAMVAIVAAYIAFKNTSRTLAHNEHLERNRRRRKHSAIRAAMPLALAQVSTFASKSAEALAPLLSACVSRTLPKSTAPKTWVELPSETLKTFADFIEYSDDIDTNLIESIISLIQIHNSRINDMIQSNHDPLSGSITLKINIENYIVDAASIYAGAAVAFDYSRRRKDLLPTTISWDDVRKALRNLRFWDEEFEEVFTQISHREKHSLGPFDQ